MKPYLTVINDPIPTLNDLHIAQKEAGLHIPSTCDDISYLIQQAKSSLASLKQLTPEQGRYIGTEEQWKREIKQLETTCVAIAVQISQLARIAEKHGVKDASVEDGLTGQIEVTVLPPEKRYHRWWIVPQIREVR